MKYRILIFIFLFSLIFSCGTGKQLQREFRGKPVTILKESFGQPKTVLDQGNDTIYVFEKVKELKSTEISQGKLTLDAIVTPKVNKTERYYFTVRNGTIIDTRYEEEYERK